MPSAPLPPTGAGGNARGALVDFSRRAPRTAALAALGEGISAIADTINGANKGADAVKSVESEGRAKREIADKLAALDPLAADYDKRAREVVDTVKESVLSGTEMATNEGRTDLSLRLTRLGETEYTLAQAVRRSAVEKEAERVFGESRDAALDKIRKDPDGFDAYLGEFSTQSSRLMSGISPEKRPALAAAFGDAAIVAQAEGLALAGRYDEARKVADENGKALSPEVFRSLKQRIREVETQNRVDAETRNEATVSDIGIKTIDAQNTGELSALRQRAEAEIVDPLKKLAVIGRIEAKRQQLVKKAGELDAAMADYGSGRGTGTQKATDLVWGEMSRNIEGRPPDEVLRFGGEFSARAGKVPTQLKRLVENGETVEEPKALAVAARAHDEIKARAPEVDTGAETGASSRVRLASAVVKLRGASYEDAAALVLRGMPDKKIIEERDEKFKTDFGKTFDPRKLLERHDAALAKMTDARVAADFEEMLRLNYRQIGDKPVAVEASLRQFRDRYGVTGIGGGERVALHPAERYFPIPLKGDDAPLATTAVNADVRRLIDAAGIEVGIVAGAEKGVSAEEASRAQQRVAELRARPDAASPTVQQQIAALLPLTGGIEDMSGLPPYRLFADRLTDDALARGEQPSWRIQVRNSTGAYSDAVVRRKDGTTQVLRYVMPTAEEAAALPEYRAVMEPRMREAEEALRRSRENELIRRRLRGPEAQ